MVWSNSDDSHDWPKAEASPKSRKRGKGKKTAGRRHTVLGKWHQIKLEMYERCYYMLEMEQSENEVYPDVPF